LPTSAAAGRGSPRSVISVGSSRAADSAPSNPMSARMDATAGRTSARRGVPLDHLAQRMTERIEPGIARRKSIGARIEQRGRGKRMIGTDDAVDGHIGRLARQQIETQRPLQQQVFAVPARHRNVNFERVDTGVLVPEIIV